jgi:hypothetical protein
VTELEKMLKDSLARMERDLYTSLTEQGKALEEQRQILLTQSLSIKQMQGQIRRNEAELQALMPRLQDFGAVYKSLEPLLSRLNGLLSGG